MDISLIMIDILNRVIKLSINGSKIKILTKTDYYYVFI